ncbi:arsenite efflux transporter metallochaperone ArsD [Ruminococcus callidus]|uniref:arsenite efflux transporter metallochaperone ArsD n=1 Tax=Ruminococcus callidus TaxID=40519 RepID=UPI003522F848
MKKMCIYEPALCCETGLCGVNVDPELLRISTALNTLKNEGVVIERYNLNNAPMEFVKSSIVNQYVNEKGVDGLPVVTVDGEIVLAGRYPANDEILTLLDLPAELLLPKGAASCCCDTDCTEICCEPEETDNNGCCCGSSCC